MRRLLRALASAAALAALLSACGGGGNPDTITYRDAEDRSLFELPNDWHLYRADELVQVAPVPFLPDTGGNIVSFVAFDGAAGRNLGNVALDAAASEFPVGAQIIRRISDTERNDISNRSMALSAYNAYTAGLGVEMLNLVDDPSFDRNYDGIRGYLGVTLQDGSLEGVIYVRAVHNPDMTELYSMAAGCSLDCFTRERDVIEEAVNSWVVNTRR
ncbi:MAG: hypothetical protein OXS29_07255 [bacterium]|nr:hypothetical protein [bacterium]MDE0289646.1 hypothetical protein [bacterium]MDE0437920.1 hypothetical protein [bacterium]